MTTLVMDCGGTRCSAAVTDGNATHIYELPGFNASTTPHSRLEEILDNLHSLADLNPRNVGAVYFYGAGCRDRSTNAPLRDTFARVFPQACDIAVESDMLGAARALCGDNPGIVGILGTGSNSCLYTGRAIAQNTPPLGYILGDEGSGVVLGRKFMQRLFKGRFPETVRQRWDKRYRIDIDRVIDRVYRQPGAARYLASFAPFIHDCADIPEGHRFIIDEFTDYIRFNLSDYLGFKSLPVYLSGSVAYWFKDHIAQALANEGCTLGAVIESPIQALAAYHNQRQR